MKTGKLILLKGKVNIVNDAPEPSFLLDVEGTETVKLIENKIQKQNILLD
ncbi:MAG: hypothetical protein H8E85_01520 [Candidatus Marinimicrobia bacterium]|nr:hypothetical protein [Candidatus Neomarinimicrobiota bacterium]